MFWTFLRQMGLGMRNDGTGRFNSKRDLVTSLLCGQILFSSDCPGLGEQVEGRGSEESGRSQRLGISPWKMGREFALYKKTLF